jgi:C-terminal processing protease CtpA/Prc
MYSKFMLITSLAACGSSAPQPEVGRPRCEAVASGSPRTALRGPVYAPGPTVAADDIRADFAGWMSQLAELHPDLLLRTDMPAFERTRAEIDAALTRPMTQREAWLLFARLNPTLRDGHSGVQMPNRTELVQAHLDAGGRLFPFPVHLDADGRLRVRDAGGVHGIARGDRIVTVNGRSADDVVAELLAVTGGDTLAFRRELVARRFQIYYWLRYGDTQDYAVTIEPRDGCPREVALPGAAALPVSRPLAVRAAGEFTHKILDGGIGYLKAGDFGPEYADALAAFARQAFAAFKATRIRALIIDVRDNGGGDDPLWQQHLMEYITTKTYTHVGRYTVRVNKDNADPGDVIGEVQRNENKRRFTPSPDNPLRFDGPVYLLAGPFTYSSAIQFLVAAQDFGIARIAGRETGGLSCQTGQVKRMAMPRTGLQAVTPVIAFIRPSRRGCERGVIPDVVIDDDGLDTDRAPALLAKQILAARVTPPAPATPGK